MRPLKKRPYGISFPADGKTEQSHIDDTNINVIMARALRGQSSDYIRENPGSYGDATSLDYHQAHNLVADANSQFEELPSKIRNRFDNSPEEFLKFIHDPNSKPEAIELGLIKRPVDTEPNPTPPPTAPAVSEEPPSDPPLPK